jgi:molecular chaperone GrpE
MSDETKHANTDDQEHIDNQATAPEDNGQDQSVDDSDQTDVSSEIEGLQQQMDQLNDKHIRLVAEFENYKRRTSKERIELFSSANKELMSALLPVLDDFERAFKNTEETDATSDVIKGFRLIYNKMQETMKQKGLKPMDDCTGEPFDMEAMEAITKIPAPDESLKGKVVDQVERGYMLGDKVIRYARVVVGE